MRVEKEVMRNAAKPTTDRVLFSYDTTRHDTTRQDQAKPNEILRDLVEIFRREVNELLPTTAGEFVVW